MEELPKSMLACQVVEFHKPYKIHEVPTPTALHEHDLLITVGVASFCHSDNLVLAGVFPSKLPLIASHEASGTVVAAGSAVKGFKKGDRVMASSTYHRCGKCEDCLGPEDCHQYCPNADGTLGVHLNGAFAQYMVVDSKEAARLPDNVSLKTAAPLACAGATVWRGVLQAGLAKGQWLGIVGSGGGLGHLGVQFAKALGLHVIGIDARDEGLELSRTCGADVVVDARVGKDKVVEEVHKNTQGAGVDATINVSDAKPAATLACAITKRHGKMVQIAVAEEVSIPSLDYIIRDIKVHGTLIASQKQTEDMLAAVAKHNIWVRLNAFQGLEEIPKLVELAHSGKMQGKGVVVVDQEAVQREEASGIKML